MLLKKKTTGCPKRPHTKILNNVIFIYFQILLVTVGNTVVTLPLIYTNLCSCLLLLSPND